MLAIDLFEKWTEKYKRSIDCSNPKGFSQKAHCAGRKKTNESKPDLMDGFRELLPLAVKYLKLPKIPKIHLTKEQSGTHQASFGGYDSGTDDIHLTISNRHPVDILRTLAHELVHYRQKLNGELVDDSWKTGSDAENEANAEAGIIMRMFNKQYPEFMGVPPIISETIRKIGPSKWRLYSKDGKKNLGTFDSLKAAKKHEREVQYFKHLGEMSHREAEKILKKHHYHLERQHGGHEIWKDEEGHTFALPHKHHGKDISKGVEYQLKKEITHENTDNDLKDVADWMDTTPDNISVEVKQEPIEKFIKQIREMYGTYNEFPKDEQRTDRILKLLKQGAKPMPIYVEANDPDLFVMEGRHRMVAFWLAGMKTIPVAYVSVKTNENFADGKVRGKSRPGRVKKAGASCKGSVTSLRAKAKKYGGEKGKMYHWCANMKGGKK